MTPIICFETSVNTNLRRVTFQKSQGPWRRRDDMILALCSGSTDSIILRRLDPEIGGKNIFRNLGGNFMPNDKVSWKNIFRNVGGTSCLTIGRRVVEGKNIFGNMGGNSCLIIQCRMVEGKNIFRNVGGIHA